MVHRSTKETQISLDLDQVTSQQVEMKVSAPDKSVLDSVLDFASKAADKAKVAGTQIASPVLNAIGNAASGDFTKKQFGTIIKDGLLKPGAKGAINNILSTYGGGK